MKVSRDDLEVMDGQLYSINEESGEAKMLQAVLQEVGTISYTPEQQEADKKKTIEPKSQRATGQVFFLYKTRAFLKSVPGNSDKIHISGNPS